MAILTLAPDLGLDMADGIMPRGDLLEVYRRGSSVHAFAYVYAFGDLAEERFEGFGFGYDGFGDLAVGRITYQERWVNGDLAFTLEGLDVSVAIVLDYVQDGDVEGELAYVFRGDDLIEGSDFDDRLIAMGGHDDVYGYAGDDEVYGEGGDDYLRGGDGEDYLDGGPGWDDLHGNAGRDTLYGGSGDDWVVGGKDDDDLYGEDGWDIVLGNLGDDLVVGGAGDDVVRGGQGFDSLSGGAGSDWLSGDRGDDTMAGGPGADIFHSFAEAGIDRILDFNPAEGDRVMLDPGTAYEVAQAGFDTVIRMGSGQVVLVGVTATSLPPGWIFGA
jgi:serralysin